jgi:hypothetical protein
MGSALSSSDIMALQREEDKRRQQARQQHGTGTGLGLVLNKRSQSVSAKKMYCFILSYIFWIRLMTYTRYVRFYVLAAVSIHPMGCDAM